LLKPDPPEKYNGAADLRAFMKFVTDGTAYVRDGRVPKNSRVLKLSRYLTGTAHDFYMSSVSDDPKAWRLKQFFIELYNYCFPLTFRLDQRRKLERTFQDNKTVRQYTGELRELFNTVGLMDEREKVHKLWSGLNRNLQQGLWREKLDPEMSSY
ncbi:hypothetical protein BDZ89DRAFT_907906, partial [Hymenopellis radicata]